MRFLVADYRFAKRFEAYAGIMWSQVSNGLANGFLQRSSIDPTVGCASSFETGPIQHFEAEGRPRPAPAA